MAAKKKTKKAKKAKKTLLKDDARRAQLDKTWRDLRVKRRELKEEYDKVFACYLAARKQLYDIVEKHKAVGRERAKYAPAEMNDAQKAEAAFERARRNLAKSLGYDPVEAQVSAAIQTLTTPGPTEGARPAA